MNKNLFLLFIILFFSSKMHSQINTYGLKIGYVSSSQTFTNSSLNDIIERKSGFSVSAFVDLFDFNGFTISPEIKYIQKGWGADLMRTTSGPEPPSEEYLYVYHNYLSFPIALQYKMNSKFGKPLIKIALRYDILLESYDNFDSPASTYEDYKNVFGGTFSIGYVPNLNISINPFIEISYHMDFTPTYSGNNIETKNNAVEISIGVQL